MIAAVNAKILLVHRPEFIDKMMSRANVASVLSMEIE